MNTLSTAGLLSSSSTSRSGSDILSFHTGDDFLRALSSPEFGRPLALDTVISEAVQAGHIIPLRQFLSSQQSIYRQQSWFKIPSPSQVVTWGLRQLGLMNQVSHNYSDTLYSGDWILITILERVADRLLAQISSQTLSTTDRLYTREHFEDSFRSVSSSSTPLTSSDFTILLRYLSRDRPSLCISPSGTTVKIFSPSNTTTKTITKEESNIASLRHLISTLSLKVDNLHETISTLTNQAKAFVSLHQESRAKNTLRQKRTTEITLNERVKMLDNLQSVWRSIQLASDNVEVMNAMRGAEGVLKGLNKEIGDVDEVEDVMRRVREEMDTVEEVNNVMVEDGKMLTGEIDEEMVEKELEEMERVEKRKVTEVQEKKDQEEARKVESRLENVNVPTAELVIHEKATEDQAKKIFEA